MKAWRQQGSLDLHPPTPFAAPTPVALSRVQLAGASASALLVARLRSAPSVPLVYLSLSLARSLSLFMPPSFPHPHAYCPQRVGVHPENQTENNVVDAFQFTAV